MKSGIDMGEHGQQGWSGCGGGGDAQVQPYLQRSNCVESRKFFLFLLLPW